jgi:glucose/arabinose dehydrogenase
VCFAIATTLLALPNAANADEESVDAVPTGFTEKNVANAGGIATGLALTPDNKLFTGSKDGVVKVYAESFATTTLLNANALTLSDVCTDFERGLQSIAVDPDYTTNKYVYLYYTYNGGTGTNNCPGSGSVSNIVNRVVRYTYNDATNTLGSPQVILDNIPSRCGNHNGGDLKFGADGLLYVSVGDSGGCWTPGNHQSSARYKSLLAGKILRIIKDGTVPTTNPFYNEAGAVKCSDSTANHLGGTCQETFAWGFRNPFRMAFKLGTNQLYVNDVGQNSWEEVSDVTSGNDYGWDCREGMHTYNTANRCSPTPTGMIDPIYEYSHSNGSSINGGAFVVSDGVWPAPYEGSYFFGDYSYGTVFRLVPGTPYTRQTFSTRTSGGTIITLMWDPQGDALYYTLSGGQVWRINYTATANRPPSASIAANPTSGPAPLAVNFSSAGSSDPDGDVITYGWTFGDGGTSTAQNPSHVYTNAGTFTATLVVTDSKGAASPPASITLFPGNTPPSVQIISPTVSTRFVVGQVFTLTASAIDPQEGDVTNRMRWNVELVHVPTSVQTNTHTHPFFTGNGNNLRLPAAPAPEDFDAAPKSHLRITLTVSDSLGLTTIVSQTFEPRRATLTFGTQPTGLTFSLNGTPLTTTRVISAWQGQSLQLAVAPLQQGSNGAFYQFVSWSNNGTATQTFSAPGSSTTYTATFEEVPADQLKRTYMSLIIR